MKLPRNDYTGRIVHPLGWWAGLWLRPWYLGIPLYLLWIVPAIIIGFIISPWLWEEERKWGLPR